MDIKMIKEAIIELERGDTTIENVAELANLYIIADKLGETSVQAVKAELSDIFPAYANYIFVKKQYKQNKITEGAVVKSMNLLCNEIEEFIDTLYSCTDMNRERTRIKLMSEKIFKKLQNNT